MLNNDIYMPPAHTYPNVDFEATLSHLINISKSLNKISNSLNKISKSRNNNHCYNKIVENVIEKIFNINNCNIKVGTGFVNTMRSEILKAMYYKIFWQVVYIKVTDKSVNSLSHIATEGASDNEQCKLEINEVKKDAISQKHQENDLQDNTSMNNSVINIPNYITKDFDNFVPEDIVNFFDKFEDKPSERLIHQTTQYTWQELYDKYLANNFKEESNPIELDAISVSTLVGFAKTYNLTKLSAEDVFAAAICSMPAKYLGKYLFLQHLDKPQFRFSQKKPYGVYCKSAAIITGIILLSAAITIGFMYFIHGYLPVVGNLLVMFAICYTIAEILISIYMGHKKYNANLELDIQKTEQLGLFDITKNPPLNIAKKSGFIIKHFYDLVELNILSYTIKAQVKKYKNELQVLADSKDTDIDKQTNEINIKRKMQNAVMFAISMQKVRQNEEFLTSNCQQTWQQNKDFRELLGLSKTKTNTKSKTNALDKDALNEIDAA